MVGRSSFTFSSTGDAQTLDWSEVYQLDPTGLKLQPNQGYHAKVTATVDDPGAYNMPWSGVQRWSLGPRRDILEQVCAENSDEFFNYDVVPIPRAEKPDF